MVHFSKSEIKQTLTCTLNRDNVENETMTTSNDHLY